MLFYHATSEAEIANAFKHAAIVGSQRLMHLQAMR
jgi:hypothetical protein